MTENFTTFLTARQQICHLELTLGASSPKTSFRGFAKGWFPKGWFWRMFPRNENRNEGTFAKTTLLETALLSPSDPFWCRQKGGFQKGGFGGCSPGTKTGTRVRSPKPPFCETALLSPSDRLNLDCKWGRFPILSRHVPFCSLRLSSLVPICPCSGPLGKP